MNVISQETASRIVRAYREIAASKALRHELENISPPPFEAGAFWRTGIEMAIPITSSAKRISHVQPDLAARVIDAHLEAMAIELAEASALAQAELAGETAAETTADSQQ